MFSKLPLSAGILLIVAAVILTGIIAGISGLKSAALVPAAVALAAVCAGTLLDLQFGAAALIITAHFIGWISKLHHFPFGILVDLIEALLIVSFFIRKREKQERKNITAIGAAIIIWLGYNITELANPWAESHAVWFYTIRSASLVLLLYFVFCDMFKTKRSVDSILNLWTGLSVICALYAVCQRYSGFLDFEIDWLRSDPLRVSLFYIDSNWRIFSVFQDPVVFAFDMAVSSIFCLSRAFMPVNWKKRVLFLSLAIFFMWTMLFSGVRAAYIMTVAGIGFMILLNLNTRVVLGSLLAILVCVPFLPGSSSNPLVQRFMTAFRPMEDASFKLRLENQTLIKPYLQSHPIGAGLGAAGLWGKRFSGDSYLASFPPDSGYVRVAVEQGWIGLLIFSTLVFATLVSGIRNYFRSVDRDAGTYCMAMTAAVFALNVGNYPQQAFAQPPITVFFCLAAAIITVTPELGCNGSPDKFHSGLKLD